MPICLDPALIRALSRSLSVTVMTGAGISAESGIDTFRDGTSGLWANFRPQDLATPEAFARDPSTVWDWYCWRRAQVARAQPNSGHQALVKLEQRYSAFRLITQNVDRLHQTAGSRSVIELHGNVMQSICHITRQVIDENYLKASQDSPPRSPHHRDGLARPNVVWFGEALPEAALQQAVRATQCQLFFSIGTSAVVEPAASLARMALQAGAVVVEINPSATPLTPDVSHVINAPASQALAAILRAIE